MSKFIVHSIPGSPFGRAVLATLVEKNASFRLAPLDPRSIKSQPYLSKHPFGRVPVLEHEGFTLYETQAILRHIDRVLPVPPMTPSDPKLAARMDQIMGINDWYLHQGVNSIIGFQRIVRPRLLGMPCDEAAVAEAMPRAQVVCAELSRLLGTSPYLAGTQLSLADMVVASQMDFLAQTPEWAALTAERPNLPAWLARIGARESFQATTWERVAEMAKAA
ncbi:MAG TPA: glutathione S-transferase family protein [Steroidobacteraceae bacterium]|jgi:glutathione S-transferase|nr:glutathione S-transferase family protein [Steroidobacteraceae bacterium]